MSATEFAHAALYLLTVFGLLILLVAAAVYDQWFGVVISAVVLVYVTWSLSTARRERLGITDEDPDRERWGGYRWGRDE